MQFCGLADSFARVTESVEAIRGDKVTSLTYLQASITAGWLDYRSPRLDPRFDAVAANPEFQKIVSEMAAHVASLKQQLAAARVE